MSQTFYLHWLREDGCNAGTPLRVGELDPSIQARILELAGDSPELVLLLPYLDKLEWRKRETALAALRFERHGDEISAILAPAANTRNTAANLALTHPAWFNAPVTDNPRHFPVWQNVSMTLQRCFHGWIPSEYFRETCSFEDRDAAYTLLLYQAARLCHGRARGDFTYDLHDYPVCQNTVEQATKMTGLRLQAILAGVERRLVEAGNPELARRYAPIWHEDIVIAVRKRPKQFIALLTAESAFINALVELGLNKTPAGVHRFAKLGNQALRRVCRMDLRHLGTKALEEATSVLADSVVRSVA